LVVSVCVVCVIVWTTSIICYVVGPSGLDVGTEPLINLTYVKCNGISTVVKK